MNTDEPSDVVGFDPEIVRGMKITGPDIDLEAEVILDSKGRRVDQAYIDRALAELDDALVQRAT